MKGGVLFLVFIFFFLTIQANEAIDDQVRRIAHELRCPTCQGLSVKESEAGIAMNMKSKIKSLLKEGKSESEIIQFFVDRYGEWILRNPQKKGFNLLLWTLPGILTVLAIILFFLSAKNWVSKTTVNTKPELSAEEKLQIEKDLDRFNSV